MLWTEIKQLVTRDGKTYGGVQVRDWLKQRGVLAVDDTSDSIAIVIDEDLEIVLRTREEVTAWLRHNQLASAVELGPVPNGNPVQRQAVRGRGSVNRNLLPMTIEFVDESGLHSPLTELAVVQGAPVRVHVRVSPGPRRCDKRLELAFIGAKARTRGAIRSVKNSDSGYHHLSRVRLAQHKDGIRQPLEGMNTGFYKKDYPQRSKSTDRFQILEFTVLGLEAGTETLQACMLEADGTLVCSAVLQITVSLAPTGVGALRAFHNATVDAFQAADPEFDSVHKVAPNKADEVKVGICDTGIFDDGAGDNYLAERWVAGRYFDGDSAKDRNTKAGAGQAHHILDFRESPSMHGTNVSGQAAWGTKKIKLVDIMVQRGQEMGSSGVDAAAAAAARAFTWARDDGQVSVVNCSKVIPFRKAATNDVVAHATTKSQVLFLATAGNSSFSFPLNTQHPKAANNEVTADNMPTSMDNTLWGGGCKRDRTPHPSRGHGPAVEVMVPSDNPFVYSPREVRRAFRMKMLQKTFEDLPGLLDGRANALGNPPAQIPGGHTVAEQAEYATLHATATTTGFTGMLGGIQQKKYNALVAKLAPRPNPDVPLKQAYVDLAATIRNWALDTSSEANRATSLVAWAGNLFQANDDLKTDASVAANFVGLATIAGPARVAVQQLLNETIERKNLRAHRTELAKIQPDTPNVASDDGVSFGLPVVANIAAKLKLINSTLTPNKLKRIIIDTSDIDPGFESQCVARGIVNPLRAYLAAFDNVVSTGGTAHHDVAVATDGALAENRRIYYTFFYMDPQGLEVYEKIKQRLHDDYRAANIDLVEAEPPILIPSEPVTYVAGRSLMGHNWRKVVPVKTHPLVYTPKHLRLVLLNQAALAEGNPFSGRDTQYTLVWNAVAAKWEQENAATAKVVLRAVLLGGPKLLVEAKIRDSPEYAKLAFAPRMDHMVTRVEVLSDGDLPLGVPDRPPIEFINPSLSKDRHMIFTVVDPAVNTHITTNARKIKLEFGVIQRIGGSADGANIFVNNSYHAGASGTADANNSVVVLFLHEIGHALGMVPETHATYYQNAADAPPDQGFGGDGKHCSFNTENKTNAEAGALGLIPDGRSGSVKVPVLLTQPGGDPLRVPCVMYHTRTSVHCKSKFCDTCKATLTAPTLEPKWSWRAE